ncbi:MAG TPA: phenylalanine--tRNA ligase subunit beta [Longimicrobiales bacterium]|nr:phenylalanine--tRNA ligase subunit beta [Longimicrobiales bacterium]
MNISYRWLRELAPGIEGDADEVARRLAGYGAPVDAMVRVGELLKDIRVARVLEAGKHPNADRLSVCRVEVEPGVESSVVCGAPNVRAGAFYPFAPPGATLPDGMTIRKAKIRGQTSEGMLCSAKELGIGRDAAGILELHGEFTPGQAFATAVGLDDVRLEVDVTANRPDLLSHLGVARELAPGGEAGLALPAFPGGAAALHEGVRFAGAAAAGVPVSVEDAGACARYTAAVIRGVRVGPSPAWLAARLRAIGQRPINNVVDATNWVLHELGQPIHAFDLARLRGPAVGVRRARSGETLTTLDGERRKLTENVLVITDGEGPVALAGIMGGQDSEVTAETTDVLLEVALFHPKVVRAGRRELGMSTDASYRFERGVDPEGVERAARRCLALIVAVAGGRVEEGAADVGQGPGEAPRVAVRPARASALLGIPFEAGRIEELLTPLGLRRDGERDGAPAFRVPGWRRSDLEREVDLIEEVARRHGYDAFPEERRPFRASAVPEAPLEGLEARLRELLVGRGFLEAHSGAFAPDGEGDVALKNPLAATEARLRRDLVAGLLHRLEHNWARGARHVRLFDIGTAFAPGAPGELPRESRRLAAVLTGARRPPHWTGEPPAFEVWDARALLEELAGALGGGRVVAGAEGGEEATPALGGSSLLEGRESFSLVDAAGRRVGVAGRVRSAPLDAPAWASPTFALELLLEEEMARARPARYRALPTQPATERDVALVVPEDLPAERVETVIGTAGGPRLESVEVFDVYAGRGIPDGSRSIAFRLRFRAPDRTLTDEEADAATAAVLARLEEELGVHRRG